MGLNSIKCFDNISQLCCWSKDSSQLKDKFSGLKARLVDNLHLTEGIINESSSLDCGFSTVTNNKIVGDSTASTEMCTPKPNTNIKNMRIFCKNDIGNYLNSIAKLEGHTQYWLLWNLRFCSLTTGSLILFTRRTRSNKIFHSYPDGKKPLASTLK